jgi:hypothetical protein
VLALILAIPANAASRAVQIDVQSQIEPSTAVGLVISADKTTQILDTTISKSAPGVITVTIPVPESAIGPDTTVSAVVLSAKGEVVFGNVKPVLGAELDLSLTSIPLCPPEQVSIAALSSQVSLLEELHRIRQKRRDQAKAQAAQLLSEDLLERLQKLERGFGLARETPLSADLPPLELVDRLSRLNDALRSWETRAQ